jgi:hypothetical protein
MLNADTQDRPGGVGERGVKQSFNVNMFLQHRTVDGIPA